MPRAVRLWRAGCRARPIGVRRPAGGLAPARPEQFPGQISSPYSAVVFSLVGRFRAAICSAGTPKSGAALSIGFEAYGRGRRRLAFCRRCPLPQPAAAGAVVNSAHRAGLNDGRCPGELRTIALACDRDNIGNVLGITPCSDPGSLRQPLPVRGVAAAHGRRHAVRSAKTHG
jgi:hypothetical protein